MKAPVTSVTCCRVLQCPVTLCFGWNSFKAVKVLHGAARPSLSISVATTASLNCAAREDRFLSKSKLEQGRKPFPGFDPTTISCGCWIYCPQGLGALVRTHLTVPLESAEGWAVPSPCTQLYNILDMARTGVRCSSAMCGSSKEMGSS